MATQSDCAIHLFISLPRLRDLIDTGVITRQPPSEHDLDTVRRECLTHLRARAAARDGDETLAHERMLYSRARRELAEVKAAQLCGAVVEVERVADALENRYVTMRELLLGIPGKLADRLTGRERHDVFEILRQEIHDVLLELASPAEVVTEAGGRPDHLGQADPPA
jgi:hypothetical protein